MKDRFGVPDSYFGPIEDDFAQLLARVMMVAALLENQLWALLSSLDHRPQETFAGDSASGVIGKIRILINEEAPARTALSPDEKEAILDAVGRAEAVIYRRNDVVHSVWARATVDGGHGWRHVVFQMRTERPRWSRSLDTSREFFVDLIGDLVAAYEEVNLQRQVVEGHARAPLGWEHKPNGSIKR